MTEKQRKEALCVKLVPGMRTLEYAIVEKFQLSYMSDCFKMSWKDLCNIINDIKENPDNYYHERDPYLSDEARRFFEKYGKQKMTEVT